jgi:hypothetical protein
MAGVEADRPEPPAIGAVGRELRAPGAAGVAGLVFAALFVTGVVLLYRQPARGASDAEISAWFHGNAKTVGLVGLYVVPFAGIAFLWFVAAVRARIGAYEDRFFATVFMGSGILFVALLYAAAAAAGASLAAVKFQGAPPPTGGIVAFSRGLAYSFLYIYGVRAAAVFMIVSSTIGLRTRTLPRWLVVAGYTIALVLLFSVSFFKGFVLVFPVWVALVSVELLRRGRAGGPQAARARPT